VANLNERMPAILAGKDGCDAGVSEVLFSFLENAKISADYIKSILQRGAGFFPGEAERTSISTIMRKAIRITREATQIPTDIEVHVAGVPDISFYPANLLIALMQLLQNAVEVAGPTGHVRLRTEYQVETTEVRIYVSNSGEAIPPQIRDHVFDAGVSTKGDSHGIGLYVARRSLEAVGAHIELVGSDTVETCFLISLHPLEIYPGGED